MFACTPLLLIVTGSYLCGREYSGWSFILSKKCVLSRRKKLISSCVDLLAAQNLIFGQSILNVMATTDKSVGVCENRAIS